MCEHPSCTRLISNKCSNHCQLDLCNEHLIEHKNLFIIQYEKSFNILKNSLNELINCIEKRKFKLNQNYQEQISLIDESFNNKANEIEQKSLLVFATQHLIKKKRQLLTDVINDQGLLYQYDIEQIKLYRNKIQEYLPTDIEIISSASSLSSSPLISSPSSTSASASASNFSDYDIDEDDEEYEENDNENEDEDEDEDNYYYHKSSINLKADQVKNYYGQCPLTRLNVYGLQNSHNLRLCPSETVQPEYNLMTHFYNYHHIKWSIAYQLTKAIINKSNPFKTCIFQSGVNIIDKRFYTINCPLYASNLSNCRQRFHKDSLKQHLLNKHHLSLEIINKICEEFQEQGHLRSLHLNENKFK